MVLQKIGFVFFKNARLCKQSSIVEEVLMLLDYAYCLFIHCKILIVMILINKVNEESLLFHNHPKCSNNSFVFMIWTAPNH